MSKKPLTSLYAVILYSAFTLSIALLPARADAVNSHRIYLIDPLGNAMMFYAPAVKSKGVLEDLKRLLSLSSIG